MLIRLVPLVASAESGGWEISFNLLENILKTGLTPDDSTYRAVFLACYKAAQVRSATAVVLFAYCRYQRRSCFPNVCQEGRV